MRTCPACGKENDDTATHCATCDEEIGAGAASVAAAEGPKGTSAEGDHETLAVSLSELRAMSSKDEAGEKAEKAAEQSEEAEASAPAAVATSVAAAGENHVPKASTAVEVTEKPTDEKVEESPAAAAVAEKPAVAAPVEESKAAQATQMVQVEPSSRGPQSFQPGTVKLVVEQGMSVNKEYLLNDPELIIGRRDPEQEFIPDIDLFDQENANNRYISRRQARLYFQEGHLFVEDLDSSNGTCVNNRPIKPNMSVQLNPGDKLLLGQSVMFRIRPMTS